MFNEHLILPVVSDYSMVFLSSMHLSGVYSKDTLGRLYNVYGSLTYIIYMTGWPNHTTMIVHGHIDS